MSEESTELELVSNNEEVKPAKKVTKKKVGVSVAKLTPQQKARAKAMSKARGVKYPNAWSNLKVARGKKSTKKGKK